MNSEQAARITLANNVKHARQLIARAEADGVRVDGRFYDLIADNTSWDHDAITRVVAVLKSEGNT